MKHTIACVLCTLAAITVGGGCASQGELREAKENQQNLSSQLAQAQKERDDWKARYDQLRVDADANKARSTDVDKKLADRETAVSSQKAELDAATAKLAESNAQLAKVQTELTAAQRDQAALKQMQQKLAAAEQAAATAQQESTGLKAQLAAERSGPTPTGSAGSSAAPAAPAALAAPAAPTPPPPTPAR